MQKKIYAIIRYYKNEQVLSRDYKYSFHTSYLGNRSPTWAIQNEKWGNRHVQNISGGR